MAENQQEAYNLAGLEDFYFCDFKKTNKMMMKMKKNKKSLKIIINKEISLKENKQKTGVSFLFIKKYQFAKLKYSKYIEFNLNSLNNHFKKRSLKSSLICPYDNFNQNDYYLHDKQKQQDFVDNQIFKKEYIGPWEREDRFKSCNQDAVHNFNSIQQINQDNNSNSNSMEIIEKSKDSPQILDQNSVKQFILRTSHKQNVYKMNYNSDKEYKTNQKLKESFANFLKEMTKQKLNQNLIQIDKIKEQNNTENKNLMDLFLSVNVQFR